MDYELAFDAAPGTVPGAPATVPGGTAILLLHPSTAATDRIDTDFLRTDTDYFLVISTRTTAREVMQKLDYYDVAEEKAVVLDTLSVERGYSRRSAENVHYVSAPDDVEGILIQTRQFLESHSGKRRLSFDSMSELAYYAGTDRALEALDELVRLLDEHDAVGLFHIDKEVHDDETIAEFRARCDGVVDQAEDGSITCEF